MKNTTPKPKKSARPQIPQELWAAARVAGAPMELEPTNYIVLCLRDGLRRAGILPLSWEMSPEEIRSLDVGEQRPRLARLGKDAEAAP